MPIFDNNTCGQHQRTGTISTPSCGQHQFTETISTASTASQAPKSYKFNTLAECEENMRSLRKDYKVVKHVAAKALIKKELDEIRKIYDAMLTDLKKINLNEVNKLNVDTSIKQYLKQTRLNSSSIEHDVQPYYEMGSIYPHFLNAKTINIKANVDFEFEIPVMSTLANKCRHPQDIHEFIISNLK